MGKERNKAVPAVYLILEKGDEILLMRRQNSGYYEGWYSVPAGHVEAGELPLDALLREVKEELGIELNKSKIRLVHSMYRTKHDETGDRMDLFFVATRWSGELVNGEPHKCSDIRWFPVAALPEHTVHHVREAVANVEDGVTYSELGLNRIAQNPSG